MQKNRLENEKNKILDQARKEARNILLDARREADEIMERLRELEKAQQQSILDTEIMQLKHDMRQKINKLDERMAESVLPRKGYAKPPENLKAGDSVMIINLNRKGTILEAPDKDGNVLIQVGIMKVNMHITQLRLIDEQKELVDNIQITRVSGAKSSNVGLELDIRGCSIEEAGKGLISISMMLQSRDYTR